MKTGQVGVLAIVLGAGCAHHSEANRTNAQAPSEHHRTVAAGGVETDEPRAVAEEQADRIDVPKRGNAHDQLATAGHDLPVNKPKADEPTSAAAYGTAPDNTRVNERDRASSALTPMDQSESEADRDLVQRIRKAVIADDSLSFTAKNVKIITRDGRVTLRGAVNNAREKATIEQAARAAAGPKSVTSELEVSNN